MAHQVMTRDVKRWLLRNGFEEKKSTGGGHLYFTKNGHKIVIPGHGPSDLSKKVFGHIVSALVEAGFDRDAILTAFGKRVGT